MAGRGNTRGGGASGRHGDASQDRNEYIPSFISKQPFYVAKDSASDETSNDYLEHQRLQKREERSDLDAKLKWYQRGRKTGPAATKWRKGACENCGAMGHARKDCLEKPRAKGARWTNQDIRTDDVVQDLSLGWDAKRDRWNGFDPAEYRNVVEQYNALDELQKPKKQLDREGSDEGDGEEEVQEDDAKYAEETDMGRKQPTSTRNLRLREDTAKYLIDLDLESARYDPKSRTMIGGDNLKGSDKAAALIAEEGFMKASGEAAEFESAQRYAWETQERGDKNKIHLQANPTEGEFLRKKAKHESETKRESTRKALLDKYGGEQYLQNDPSKNVAVVESDRFVEYDEQGRLKGAPEVKAESMYKEDVLINNHTSVWGSWWKDFNWGYACCHSIVKNSYCTGEQGKRALEEMDQLKSHEDEADNVEGVPKQIAWKEEAEHEKHVPNGVEDDAKATQDLQTRKRRVEEMKEGVTEEQLDEFRRKRVAADDPMAKYLGKDELVH